MLSSPLIAWYQLSYHKVKLAVAALGVVVAVMLILVQLGIRQGALDSSTAMAHRVSADLVMISPRTRTIFQSTPFPRRFLYRIAGHGAVERVREVYMGQAKLRNSWEHREYPISVYGLEPSDPLMNLPGLQEHAAELEPADSAIFDAMSRRSFGPIAHEIKEHGSFATEVNYRLVKFLNTISVGISISSDGNMFVTPANFLRLFPTRQPGSIDMGLIRLRPGTDRERVKLDLKESCGREVIVMTRDELLAAELRFLRESHPLDFIFGMGVVVGFFIGFVVVYQILYSEVTNHLPHFATMKAMGFTDGFLVRVVLSQGLILAVLGYFPGFLMALGVYQIATVAIQMPFEMTVLRATSIFALTVVMCSLSALIAIQKVRTADPADVF